MFEGIILGIVSWMSIVLTWMHFPERIKRFSLRHPVMSDISAGLLTYLFLSSISKSLVAAAGAVVTGLLVNLSIMGAKWREENGHSELRTIAGADRRQP